MKVRCENELLYSVEFTHEELRVVRVLAELRSFSIEAWLDACVFNSLGKQVDDYYRKEG